MEKERWRAAIEARLRGSWPYRSPPDADELADIERWIGRWLANGCDLERDVMSAVGDLCQFSPYRGPPRGLGELSGAVARNRNRRMQAGGRPN